MIYVPHTIEILSDIFVASSYVHFGNCINRKFLQRYLLENFSNFSRDNSATFLNFHAESWRLPKSIILFSLVPKKTHNVNDRCLHIFFKKKKRKEKCPETFMKNYSHANKFFFSAIKTRKTFHPKLERIRLRT